MELDFEVMIDKAADLTPCLTNRDGRLLSEIEIGHGVTLVPQFTSLRSAHAIGEMEILLFLLGIPVGVATDILASALYDWLTRNKVHGVRINRQEIMVWESKEKFIRQVSETIETE